MDAINASCIKQRKIKALLEIMNRSFPKVALHFSCDNTNAIHLVNFFAMLPSILLCKFTT